jgi:hypothetical protein
MLLLNLEKNMPPKVITCHQPNFLPWLGFFAKLAQSDEMILLDDVQFTQGIHNWTTRVKVLGPNGPFWLTIPIINCKSGFQKIMDLRTFDDYRWTKKVIKTIESSYGKTKFYSETIPPIIEIIEGHTGLICDTNIRLIEHIKEILKINTLIFKSSDIYSNQSSNEKLIELILSRNGGIYLSGNGASEYQDERLYKSRGIEIEYSRFVHAEYPQLKKGAFYSGLSIIDALCSIGSDETRKMICT